MQNNMRNNFIISVTGLGVAVGALAPVVRVPIVVIFAVGLGMMLGGVFRTLNHIQYKLKDTTASN